MTESHWKFEQCLKIALVAAIGSLCDRAAKRDRSANHRHIGVAYSERVIAARR